MESAAGKPESEGTRHGSELRPVHTRSEADHTPGGGGGSSDLDHALSVLRARVDEEFRISERLDSKSRQAFALAAAFFAVVQTVTFGSFAQEQVTPVERAALLAVGVLAGLAVAVVAHRLSSAEDLKDEIDIAPDAIVGWLNDAGDDPDYVAGKLVDRLRKVAKSRHSNNATRERNYERLATATRAALILAGVELLVALVVRV